MNQFLKVHLPVYGTIAALIAYFSGYVYINEYFRFFGVTGFYTKFSPLYLGFFSFSVFHELIWFEDAAASFRFFFLVLVLLGVFLLPDFRLVLPKGEWPRLARIMGSDGASLLPASLRAAVAAIAIFLTIFNVSGRIGYLHGCRKLMDGHAAVRFFGLSMDSMTPEQKATFDQLQNDGKLTEIWADDKVVYVGEKIGDCDTQTRTTFRISRDTFKYYLTSKSP